DHYDTTHAPEIIKFGNELKDNKCAYNVLKRLLADYVNYFEVRGSERQALVDKFKLSGSKEYLLNVSKTDRTVPAKNRRQMLPPKRKKKINSLSHAEAQSNSQRTESTHSTFAES